MVLTLTVSEEIDDCCDVREKGFCDCSGQAQMVSLTPDIEHVTSASVIKFSALALTATTQLLTKARLPESKQVKARRALREISSGASERIGWGKLTTVALHPTLMLHRKVSLALFEELVLPDLKREEKRDKYVVSYPKCSADGHSGSAWVAMRICVPSFAPSPAILHSTLYNREMKDRLETRTSALSLCCGGRKAYVIGRRANTFQLDLPWKPSPHAYCRSADNSGDGRMKVRGKIEKQNISRAISQRAF